VHDVVVGAEFSAAVVAQTYSIEALTACITRCATADDAAFLVAERDGGGVGYLHYDCEGTEPELHRIYGDPSSKRGGIGNARMHALHARLPPGGSYVLLVAELKTDARRGSTNVSAVSRGAAPRAARRAAGACRRSPSDT
jgi:hypothetical protein